MKQIIQSARTGKLECVEVPAPTPGPGQVLVRTAYSVVSPGTEKMAMEFARTSLLGKARERLEALLALESDDPETEAAIAAANPPPWIRVVRTPPGGPRTKPKALNHALDLARGSIIGVYDAEDRPEPVQLRRVAEAFAQGPARLACVQARLAFANERDGWIARCFAVEYLTWFRVVLPGMARLGFPLPLAGTSLFLRRRTLERSALRI